MYESIENKGEMRLLFFLIVEETYLAYEETYLAYEETYLYYWHGTFT
ncbi:hypothetical protein [Flavobacterium cucumis]|nr:hypothetical protein [Flavobacterium cucumis]